MSICLKNILTSLREFANSCSGNTRVGNQSAWRCAPASAVEVMTTDQSRDRQVAMTVRMPLYATPTVIAFDATIYYPRVVFPAPLSPCKQ